MSDSVGKHYIVDLYGCPPGAINNVSFLKDLAIKAVKDSKATILQETFRTFEPQGVTGVIIVAESHLSLHTWPEFGYLALDYFTCGNRVVPEKTINAIVDALQPAFIDQKIYERGTRMDTEFGYEPSSPTVKIKALKPTDQKH